MRSSRTSSMTASACGETTQRLFRADTEETYTAQRFPEQTYRPILQLAVEINEHVAAGHQLHLREHTVGGETMVRKHDVLSKRLVEHRPAVGGSVIVGQRYARTRAVMIVGEAGDALELVDAGLRLR